MYLDDDLMTIRMQPDGLMHVSVERQDIGPRTLIQSLERARHGTWTWVKKVDINQCLIMYRSMLMNVNRDNVKSLQSTRIHSISLYFSLFLLVSWPLCFHIYRSTHLLSMLDLDIMQTGPCY